MRKPNGYGTGRRSRRPPAKWPFEVSQADPLSVTKFGGPRTVSDHRLSFPDRHSEESFVGVRVERF